MSRLFGAQPKPRRPLAFERIALWIAVTVLMSRAVILVTTPLDLGPDEAQYWGWSRDLAWGYFSKPPLIAWVIAASTAWFGDWEWAVRFPALIAHACGALFVGAACWQVLSGQAPPRSGTDLSPTAAAWLAGLLYFLAPGIQLSSLLITTDALLLPAMAAVLWSWSLLRRQVAASNDAKPWGAYLALGIALGLGLLAKYAMIYAVLGLALACWCDVPTRRALLRPMGLITLVAVLVLVAPNLVWNAAHKFQTFGHTAANANWQDREYNILHSMSFLGAQFGLWGPVVFGLFLYVLVTLGWARNPLSSLSKPQHETSELPWQALLAFTLPPLVVVSIQAFISRANANWAAIAMVPGILIVALFLARNLPNWRLGALLASVIMMIPLNIAAVSPPAADKLGLTNSLKRVRGWEASCAGITQMVRAADPSSSYTAVVFDNRLVFHECVYYARREGLPPMKMWLKEAQPRSHAEATAPLLAGTPGPFLLVSQWDDQLPLIRQDFRDLQQIGSVTVPLGRKKLRQLKLFEANGFEPRLRAGRAGTASSDENP